jgi:nitric oxide reductase NorQ protein
VCLNQFAFLIDIKVDSKQYMIKDEPYYEAVNNEVELYQSAYDVRMPMMIKGPTGCGKSSSYCNTTCFS